MKTTIRYILLTARRDKLFAVLIALMLALLGITMALSETVMVENAETHIAMSGGLNRLVLNIGLAVFVCFYVRAMYDNKEVDVMLSRPISRPKFVLSLWAGFAIVAAVLAGVTTLMLAALQPATTEGLLMWGGTLWLEQLVVIAIALFAALAGKSAVSSVLVSFAFYALGRLMAYFVATAQSRMAVDELPMGWVLRYLIEIIAVVFPRLDMFAESEWLVYGAPDLTLLSYPVLQAAIFIPFVLALTIIDFLRKDF